MKLFDPMRNKTVRELFEAFENDTIDDHPKARKFDKKHAAYLSLDHSPKEIKEMLVAEADEDGDFATQDPCVAYLIVEQLKTGPEINHPLTKKAVRYEVDKTSPPIPSKAEYEKLMSERAKKDGKEAKA
jgi:hypothetical protein